MHEVMWRHSYRTVQNLYLIILKMKPTNPTPKHKHIFLIHLEWFLTRDLAQGL